MLTSYNAISNDSSPTFEQVYQTYRIKQYTGYTCITIMLLVLMVYIYVGLKFLRKFANSNYFITLIFLTFLGAVLFNVLQQFFTVLSENNNTDYYLAIQPTNFTWWMMTIMSIQLFMEMQAFFLFALQYLVSAIELNYLFIRDEEKSAKRAQSYFYSFVIGTLLLLTNSILYHVSFYNFKPISWIILGWMIVLFDFVFLAMMVYGLFNIRRAM